MTEIDRQRSGEKHDCCTNQADGQPILTGTIANPVATVGR